MKKPGHKLKQEPLIIFFALFNLPNSKFKNPIPLPTRNGVSFSKGHTTPLWVKG
jgi:hypothetical protein